MNSTSSESLYSSPSCGISSTDSIDDVTYEYDALGRRVQRDDGTDETIFVQNGQQTFADYASGAAATSSDYDYVYASYIDEPVYRDGTGGTRYFHRGQQYSITALTDSSATIKERYAYSAYGQLKITDASGTSRSITAEGNRYTYTGREWDDVAELYHFRARMYDAVMGRFLSRDPIRYFDGQHLYLAYFGPNGLDPTGTLRIISLGFRRGDCGGQSQSRVHFALDKANPAPGFLVQEVTVCCIKKSCQPCDDCPAPPPCKVPPLKPENCVTYYEVIWGQGRWSVMDTFQTSIPDETCGAKVIFGETRFYASSVTGPVTKTTGTGPITVPNSGGCQTSTGSFPGSRRKPHFWDTKSPDEGPAYHALAVSWDCCCDNNNVSQEEILQSQIGPPPIIIDPKP